MSDRNVNERTERAEAYSEPEYEAMKKIAALFQDEFEKQRISRLRAAVARMRRERKQQRNF